jgi:hypothetical protein
MDTWKHNFFSPDKYYQFIKGRSAYEMAKYWLNDGNQNFVQILIRKHLGNFVIDYLIPEYKSHFDGKNNPREHDGFIIDISKETIITIEAKTDEPFGTKPKYVFQGVTKDNKINSIENKENIGRGPLFIEKIIEYWKEKNKKNSKMDKRLKKILNCYFKGNKDIYYLEYQLTYWFAGTIFDSICHSSVKNILMILQQFFDNTIHDKSKIENNYNAFLELVKIVSENDVEINKNTIIGPFNNKYTNGKNIFFGYLFIHI